MTLSTLDVHDLEKEDIHPQSTWLLSSIIIIMVLGCVHASFIVLPADILASEGSMLSTRPCSFEQCEIGGCNIETSPYLCVDKNGPYTGCSTKPWDSEKTLCKESCDMTLCADTKPTANMESCNEAKCSNTWCKQYQICGSTVPFQCVDGSARFGCSADPYGWVLANDAICQSCCDIRTCDGS